MRESKCRAILAHFIGKQNWQIDARGRRRVEPYYGYERRAPSAGIPAGAADIDDFDIARGCRWRGGPAEMHAPQRRSSVRGIPGSAAALCRRTNPARPTTGATRRLIGETRLPAADRRGVPSTGAAHAVSRCFRCAALLDGGPTIRKTRGRFDTAQQRRRMRRTGNDREPAMPLASNAADRPARIKDGAARRVPGPEHKFVLRGR